MKRFGKWDPIKIDDPKENWMHPINMMKDEAVCDAYGTCHDVAEKWAKDFEGKRFQTVGGEHSIMVKDNYVYDPVRFGGKRKPLPIDEYLQDTPFEFEEI